MEYSFLHEEKENQEHKPQMIRKVHRSPRQEKINESKEVHA